MIFHELSIINLDVKLDTINSLEVSRGVQKFFGSHLIQFSKKIFSRRFYIQVLNTSNANR